VEWVFRGEVNRVTLPYLKVKEHCCTPTTLR
jgi:hypothetical protein